MSKVREVVIDADHIAFLVAKSNTYKSGFDDDGAGVEWDGDDSWGEEAEFDLEPYINHFKAIVNEYVLIAEVESICYKWTIGKTRVIMSDKTNFRYEVFADYKHNRKNLPKDEAMDKLKEWARDYYQCEPNTEADEVVAYYVRKGGIGFTTDKDLFNGVAGIWYNAHYMHRSWIRRTPNEAEFFFKQQVLAGDGVDGIPSLPKVGLLTAKKLLKKYGSDWDNILQIFNDKGFNKKYMVAMARLVSMTQWTPKGGIRLWRIPK